MKTVPAERRIGCIKTHRKCETDLKFRKWFLKVCSCLESRCNYCNMWSINFLIKDQHTHLFGHFNWRKRNFLAVCPELCRNRKRQLHYHKPLSRYYILTGRALCWGKRCVDPFRVRVLYLIRNQSNFSAQCLTQQRTNLILNTRQMSFSLFSTASDSSYH